MDISRFDFSGSRDFILIKNLEAVLTGILIGFSSFIMKIVMSSISIDLLLIFRLLIHPLAWLAGILGVAGFILLQKAFYKSGISFVIPVVGGLSIIIPVLLAVGFLNETLSLIKWIAITLILIGIVWLGKS